MTSDEQFKCAICYGLVFNSIVEYERHALARHGYVLAGFLGLPERVTPEDLEDAE